MSNPRSVKVVIRQSGSDFGGAYEFEHELTWWFRIYDIADSGRGEDYLIRCGRYGSRRDATEAAFKCIKEKGWKYSGDCIVDMVGRYRLGDRRDTPRADERGERLLSYMSSGRELMTHAQYKSALAAADREKPDPDDI